MALSTETIRFKWENKKVFSMETKLNEGECVEIIKITENGNLVDLWQNIQKICEIQINVIIEKIGKEMKS